MSSSSSIAIPYSPNGSFTVSLKTPLMSFSFGTVQFFKDISFLKFN
jgi:hypothetical protein